MAKDALGHGSDGNGAHSGAINKLPAKMTKAHFEVIAQNLRESHATPDQINEMAGRLALTNPGFNRDRFVAAVTTGAVKMGSRASSKANAAAKLGRMNKLTPVQSENQPFKSRFKSGSNYLGANDPRSR
jgi:hypothetical protein